MRERIKSLLDESLLEESLSSKANKLIQEEFYILNYGNTYMLCKDEELYSFVDIKKTYGGYQLIASTAIVDGYGIYLYDAAMMNIYPDYMRSDESGSSSDAQNIWDTYFDDRPDIEKLPMDEYEYEEIIDNQEFASDGQKTWFRLKPESWFDILMERGDEKKSPELEELMFDIAEKAWGTI